MVTAHDPDDPDSPRVARHLARFQAARAGRPDPARLATPGRTILADRPATPASRSTWCRARGFGTVCSSLLALPAAGPPVWLFAAGPPDEAPFPAVVLT